MGNISTVKNPVNTDTEEAIECVSFEGVSV